MRDKLDLYTDCLLRTVHQATATGLSNLLDGAISHDEITKLLSENEFSSRDLWKSTKKLIRTHETEDACLIFDDSIIEKRYTAESSLICWHYDHSNRTKGKRHQLINGFLLQS